MKTQYDDDLEDLALELGGSVEYDSGAVFNAAGNQAARKSRQVAAPSDSTNKILLQIAELISKQKPAITVQPTSVVVQPAKVVIPPERAPTAWQFDFSRNADGTIKTITATPL